MINNGYIELDRWYWPYIHQGTIIEYIKKNGPDRYRATLDAVVKDEHGAAVSYRLMSDDAGLRYDVNLASVAKVYKKIECKCYIETLTLFKLLYDELKIVSAKLENDVLTKTSAAPEVTKRARGSSAGTPTETGTTILRAAAATTISQTHDPYLITPIPKVRERRSELTKHASLSSIEKKSAHRRDK